MNIKTSMELAYLMGYEDAQICNLPDKSKAHALLPTTHAIIVSDASTDGATGWCKCELCGESINPWANYCSNCGAEVER